MENLIPVLRSHRTPRGDIDTARGTIVFNFVSKCDFHPLSYAFELRCVQGEQQKPFKQSCVCFLLKRRFER